MLLSGVRLHCKPLRLPGQCKRKVSKKTLHVAKAIGNVDLSIFQAVQSLDTAVASSLDGVSPISYFLVLAAGLASSFSPCTLSVLPLTIGYIGGYTSNSSSQGTSEVVNDGSVFIRAAFFGAGVASTLTLLGIISTAVGSTYGQTGDFLPIAVGCVAVAMGLNLLNVLPLSFPSLDLDVRSFQLPPLLMAYLAGLTFALAASPCSTPILATILAFASTKQSPVLGATLLFTYSLGYIAPIIIAASATDAMKSVISVRQYSGWLTPASGSLLVAGGTYAVLSRIF